MKLSVEKTVQALLKKEKISCQQVVIHFIGEKRIRELHAKFFSDPSLTDCITFPIDTHAPIEVLGEIFVCPSQAKKRYLHYQTTLEEEITLYVVHGILHLLGWKDSSEKQRRAMRKKEKMCMHFLKAQKLGIRLAAS